MSLYNLLHGINPFSKFYTDLLGLDMARIPRFRDTYLEADNQETRIVIHTRTGGGNRETFSDHNKYLTENPNYLFDRDDDFDRTYANWFFKIPEEAKNMMVSIIEKDLRKAPKEQWQDLIKKMNEKNTDDPKVKHALEVGKEIFDKLGLIK